MQFAQPLWLFVGAAICALLVVLYRHFDRRQRAALSQFAAVRLVHRLTSSVSATRRRVKRGLFLLGIALLFAALARPQVGFIWQETHRQGLEVVFAVDTSKSMLAQDVKPDRLTRAKLAMTDLVAKLNGDGVGLIAFAGDAFLQCPVTLDYDAFRESLNALDVNVIPRGGTDIASAIQEAQAVFKTRTAAEKILVLITDGEDLGGEALTAAQAAATDGVKIFTIGVGGTAGELVPIRGKMGRTDFARDGKGELVKSRLDEAMLKKIADATGAMYQPLGAQGEGLETIYEKGLAPFTRHDLATRQAKVPIERFPWPLLAALACFMAELLIGTRRRVRARAPVAPRRKGVRIARRLRPATAVVALLGSLTAGHAATVQNAEQDYQKGDFAKSQQEYSATALQHPADARLHFNAGSAAYKAGDYAQAATAFQGSLKTEQVPLQQSAYYNLGNTQYRLGQKTEKEKPEETIATWEQAVKSYNAALQITGTDAEAKHNRDLVQGRIDQLKKQQEQKKQDEQKRNQQNKDPKEQPKNQDQKGEGQPKAQNSGNEKKDAKDGQGSSSGKTENGQKPPEPPKGQPDKPGNSGKKDQAQSKPDKGEQTQGQPDQKPQDQAHAQPKPGSEKAQPAQPKPLNAGKKTEQGQGQAAAGGQAKQGETAQAGEEPREPGQMTREEARQLLDAMKGELQHVPAISQRGRAGEPTDHKQLQDW